MLYLIENADDDDEYKFIVSTDETGMEEDQDVAKFMSEIDAEEYIKWKNGQL